MAVQEVPHDIIQDGRCQPGCTCTADVLLQLSTATPDERAGDTGIPEKSRRPAAPSGTIPTCENPGVARPDVEPYSPWGEASGLTVQPLLPLNSWETLRSQSHPWMLFRASQGHSAAGYMLIKGAATPISSSALNLSRAQEDCARTNTTLLAPCRRRWTPQSTLASQGEPGSIPGRVTGFSHVGIVLDDAVGRWVSSGISRFPRPFIPAPAPYLPQSPSSVLKNSLLRADTKESTLRKRRKSVSTNTDQIPSTSDESHDVIFYFPDRSENISPRATEICRSACEIILEAEVLACESSKISDEESSPPNGSKNNRPTIAESNEVTAMSPDNIIPLPKADATGRRKRKRRKSEDDSPFGCSLVMTRVRQLSARSCESRSRAICSKTSLPSLSTADKLCPAVPNNSARRRHGHCEFVALCEPTHTHTHTHTARERARWLSPSIYMGEVLTTTAAADRQPYLDQDPVALRARFGPLTYYQWAYYRTSDVLLRRTLPQLAQQTLQIQYSCRRPKLQFNLVPNVLDGRVIWVYFCPRKHVDITKTNQRHLCCVRSSAIMLENGFVNLHQEVQNGPRTPWTYRRAIRVPSITPSVVRES
ncbi:hypothetical protein PR048_015788 [Dryococelus australis]|uniref:Uncharacterized protein n=1 Tax=Dryococelus australis TaxID=614101 RepID=A0ABQ9HHX2_9NEOP|nr:hypothetical protein PR048_015788 [Dryococelus australis]